MAFLVFTLMDFQLIVATHSNKPEHENVTKPNTAEVAMAEKGIGIAVDY